MATAIGPQLATHQARPASLLDSAFDTAVATCSIAFQPIVRYETRRGVGWEALIRSPGTGPGDPVALLEAAERLGRTAVLGRAVRRAVAGAFPRAPRDATIYVNLHPQDLLDVDLFHPRAPLSGCARRVVLELTERAALLDVDDLEDRIDALRLLGYRVAVDDLGAGFSSLALVARVRPDVLKLDGSLVRGVDRDARRGRIVEHLLALARDLGCEAVVEGIETEGERDAVLARGSPLLQGYLFGRPAPGFEPPIF